MPKLTPNEQKALAHINNENRFCGFTFGRGRPYDRRIIERLISKGVLYRPTYARGWADNLYHVEPVGTFDGHELARAVDAFDGSDEGTYFLNGICLRMAAADFNHPDFTGNGVETAREIGLAEDHPAFDQVANYFELQTMALKADSRGSVCDVCNAADCDCGMTARPVFEGR